MNGWDTDLVAVFLWGDLRCGEHPQVRPVPDASLAMFIYIVFLIPTNANFLLPDYV